MPPQQQNYQQQPPNPGMPMQGNNIFVPPPAGSPQPKKNSKLPIFLTVIFILASIGFAVLAFMYYSKMITYRDDYQTLLTADIAKATDAQKKQLEAEFAEKEKSPVRTYQAPSSAASVKIVYPKTWDLYASEDNSKGTVSNYFNENLVPEVGNKDNTYSLRLEVLDKTYSSVAKTYDSAAKKGSVTISPYKVAGIDGAETGVKIDGEVRSGITGSMIILPVRDKTIQIWTESGRYTKDFNEIVLKNLTYSP